MTDANRRRNVEDAIQRAAQALQAAQILVNGGFYADAISRAYYSALHHLRALLLSRGIEPKTHAGAIHLFNQEFVRTGLFGTAFNRLLAGLERSRELADYDSAVGFSETDATAELADAKAFAEAALAFLKKEGWASVH